MVTKIGIIGDADVGGVLARAPQRAGQELRAVGEDDGTLRDTALVAMPPPRTDADTFAVPFGASGDVVRDAGKAIAVVQTAMLGGLPCTGLRGAIITHPTMAAGPDVSFANLGGLRGSLPETR